MSVQSSPELFLIKVRFLNRLLPCVAAMLVASLIGCTATRQAPTEERRPQTDDQVTIVSGTSVSRAGAPTVPPQVTTGKTHTVRQGETLYSIALQNEVDYRELAGWNNITDPSKLKTGQVLRLSPPGGTATTAVAAASSGSGVTTAPLQTVPPVTGAGSTTTAPTPAGTAGRANYKTEPKAEKQPYSEQALMAMSQPKTPAAVSTAAATVPATTTAPPTTSTPPATASATSGDINWSWPTQGKVVSTYSDKANLKGIDIVGNIGQPVVASAAGRVVYVGSGLRGYGKLVILKHNDTFLSVYAHNRELLVQQGQQVTRGQKIAEMGNTDADQVKLHFEIRKDGNAIDPMKYLPAR